MEYENYVIGLSCVYFPQGHYLISSLWTDLCRNYI